MINRYRQTKIIATLGPSSDDKETIASLLEAGADVFRLNFSHGVHDDHIKRMKIIRELEEEYDHPIGVIADLQGPKLRIGIFKEGRISLKKGMKLRFDLDETPGDENRVNLPHENVIRVLEVGNEILLDDGKVRVEVTHKGNDWLEVEVISGRLLSNNKGFNIPDVILPVPALTEKDLADLDAALDMGVDWIAQSFVQKAKDVQKAKKIINGRASLIAKIEKPSALKHLNEIIEAADGIMIARGDLGVEIPPEDVPEFQKKIIRKTRNAGKPVVVATQMLESMIGDSRPTRAEASDVATAVYDGADAVMLSAETAAGKYPIEAVSMMDRIAQRTEAGKMYRKIIAENYLDTSSGLSDAITAAAHHVAHDIQAACIANFTTSGSTALRTVRQRPGIPILCLTDRLATARKLTISYGIRSIHLDKGVENFADTVKKAVEIAKSRGFALPGQSIVITAGVPFGTPGSTNILRVAVID